MIVVKHQPVIVDINRQIDKAKQQLRTIDYISLNATEWKQFKNDLMYQRPDPVQYALNDTEGVRTIKYRGVEIIKGSSSCYPQRTTND